MPTGSDLDACHCPPRLVRMPWLFSSAAMARRVVWPSARMASTTGARSWAKASALARRRLGGLAALPCTAERFGAVGVAEPDAAGLGGRQRLPGAAGDRFALRSATSAMMPTVRSLAWGMSQARNETPLSRASAGRRRCGESRSSLAITSVAPVSRARCRALSSSGRSLRPPLSTSVKRASTWALPRRVGVDRPPLRRETQPRATLPCGRDPLVGDEFHRWSISLTMYKPAQPTSGSCVLVPAPIV